MNLKIELLESTVFGEPGPNLVFSANKDGIKKLTSIFKGLSEGEEKLELISNDEVKIINFRTLIMISSNKGRTLNSIIDNNTVLMDLNSEYCKYGLNQLKSFKEHNTHFYFEFDDENLVEDSNVIIFFTSKLSL